MSCCLLTKYSMICLCPGCWVRWKHLGTNFISTKSLLSWADQLIEILTKGASRRKKGLSSIFTHFHFYSGFRKYTFSAEEAASLQQPAATTHVVSRHVCLKLYFQCTSWSYLWHCLSEGWSKKGLSIVYGVWWCHSHLNQPPLHDATIFWQSVIMKTNFNLILNFQKLVIFHIIQFAIFSF